MRKYAFQHFQLNCDCKYPYVKEKRQLYKLYHIKLQYPYRRKWHGRLYNKHLALLLNAAKGV